MDVNSRSQADRGEQWLTALLVDAVGKPLRVHRNIDGRELPAAPLAVEDLPPEMVAAMAAQIDRHYRQALDEPVPMLGGKTPRECAAHPTLQGEAIQWLKYLENTSSAAEQPPYDFTWIWEELRLSRD